MPVLPSFSADPASVAGFVHPVVASAPAAVVAAGNPVLPAGTVIAALFPAAATTAFAARPAAGHSALGSEAAAGIFVEHPAVVVFVPATGIYCPLSPAASRCYSAAPAPDRPTVPE